MVVFARVVSDPECPKINDARGCRPLASL